MKNLLLICSVILLASCSKDLDLKHLENKGAEEIFKLAKKEVDLKNYKEAAEIFEELEKLHPYSKLVSEAQLRAGDCFYKSKKYDEGIASFEVFIKTHPSHDKIPYALYMLGIIYFEQMPIIERDQDATMKALSYFTEVFERYPDFENIKNVELKIKELRQQMAAREVYVARYYQKSHNYAAAISRLNVVIDSYLNTIHAPEALHRLVECYVAMGFFNEAVLAYNILNKGFANTQWAAYSKYLLKTSNILESK